MWRKVVGGSLTWMGRALGKLAKLDRLENNVVIPLLCTLDDAIHCYGKPLAFERDSKFPDAMEYTFRVSPFHECVVWHWKGLIHAIVYFPEFSRPDPDLQFMFDTYGEDHGWDTINHGYLYFRKDRLVRLWCSALPPIGVATMEFWESKEAN